jgi:alcohol dehydrogenase
MLGAAHALANPLTATHGIVHGQAVGMMLPHVVRLNAAACDERFAELLAELEPALPAGPAGRAGEPAGERLARWLEEVAAAGGLVATLSGLRLSEIDIKTLAAAAATQWTGSFNPVPVGVDQLARLYEAAR